jgi:hypothetical protein
MLFFLYFAEVIPLKVVHPFKIYQYTKFHGPTLSDASFCIHLGV